MKSASKTPTANGSTGLRERILSGAISAVSFDTNIFETAGLRLEHGYLKHLEQFSKGDVRLVLSEVTLGELRIHLLRKTEAALSTPTQGNRRRHDLLGIIGRGSVRRCRENDGTGRPCGKGRREDSRISGSM